MVGKKLKILQVTPFYYPAWAYGGAPRVVYELSGSLAKRGHDVTVYTTDVLDEAAIIGQLLKV
jgi:glycogen synthase